MTRRPASRKDPWWAQQQNRARSGLLAGSASAGQRGVTHVGGTVPPRSSSHLHESDRRNAAWARGLDDPVIAGQPWVGHGSVTQIRGTTDPPLTQVVDRLTQLDWTGQGGGDGACRSSI